MRVQVRDYSNFYLELGTAVVKSKSGDIVVVLDVIPGTPLLFAPHEVIRAPVPL